MGPHQEGQASGRRAGFDRIRGEPEGPLRRRGNAVLMALKQRGKVKQLVKQQALDGPGAQALFFSKQPAKQPAINRHWLNGLAAVFFETANPRRGDPRTLLGLFVFFKPYG